MSKAIQWFVVVLGLFGVFAPNASWAEINLEDKAVPGVVAKSKSEPPTGRHGSVRLRCWQNGRVLFDLDYDSTACLKRIDAMKEGVELRGNGISLVMEGETLCTCEQSGIRRKRPQ